MLYEETNYNTDQALDIKIAKQQWPWFTQSTKGIPIPRDGLLGVDLEYDPITNDPYMASIALSSSFIFSGKFRTAEHALETFYKMKDVKFVGHNVLSADCRVLSGHWGAKPLPAGGVIDTLLAYYAMNQHLCHGNIINDDDPELVKWGRGPGRLRLGSMTSQYLLWAEYKSCRGYKTCEGPCPDHHELWYNALDAYAPILCWQEMLKEAKTFTSLNWPDGMPLQQTHDHLVELQTALNLTTEAGILIDLPFVKKFEEKLKGEQVAMFPFQEEQRIGKKGQLLSTTDIVYDIGFNPNSPKGAKDWAKSYGMKLDKYSPDSLKETLRTYERQQGTIPKGTYDYVVETMNKILEYKKLGRGVKSWFDDEYIHHYESGDYLEPEWMAYGGSMGRPVSRKPNVQNLPKRDNLAEVRKAIIAPKGLKWLKADACQGELRQMAYIGGVDPMDMGADAFNWLLEETGQLFYELAETTAVAYLKKPRNGAKQMVHACNYGEGMRLIMESSLDRPSIVNQEESGVLHIFHDWIYADKYVIGFDGSHLAKRWYGNSSWPNRRRALEAQVTYMTAFPAVIRAQKKIMNEAARGYVLTPSGHLLKLYGDNRDNIKKALAMNGQCSLSAYMQESFIHYSKQKYPPVMFIHDELGFLVPRTWNKKKCLDYVQDMSHKSKLMDGFQCPIEASWGPTYGELHDIK